MNGFFYSDWPQLQVVVRFISSEGFTRSGNCRFDRYVGIYLYISLWRGAREIYGSDVLFLLW